MPVNEPDSIRILSESDLQKSDPKPITPIRQSENPYPVIRIIIGSDTVYRIQSGKNRIQKHIDLPSLSDQKPKAAQHGFTKTIQEAPKTLCGTRNSSFESPSNSSEAIPLSRNSFKFLFREIPLPSPLRSTWSVSSTILSSAQSISSIATSPPLLLIPSQPPSTYAIPPADFTACSISL